MVRKWDDNNRLGVKIYLLDKKEVRVISRKALNTAINEILIWFHYFGHYQFIF